MSKPRKGRYKVQNPDKYVGDKNNIIYRSGWERKFCHYLDNKSDVIKWASEPFAIPYYSTIDKKRHRYYPDFLIKHRTSQGKIQVTLVEIKPFKETMPPKIPKRKTQRYLNECMTYEINQAKWRAAQAFCDERQWTFRVLTEKDVAF